MFDRLRLLAPVLVAMLATTACASETDSDEDAADDEEALTAYQPPPAYAQGKLHSDLTGEVVANLRSIHERNRGDDNAFIKVGDSITFSTDFLRCLARTPVTGTHAPLEETRRFFTAASWSRQSTASKVGWHTNEPLRGSPAPVDVEIDRMQPAFAVVMLGTNDTYAGSEPSYRRNLQALVNHLTGRGIVPILSTIPPRAQASANAVVPRMNAVVRRVAAESKVPLVDFNLALSNVPRYGLSW